VTLEATNCGGTTRRTLTVTVRPFEPPYCASLSEMNTVYFGRNSSTLTEEGRTQLQENLQILRDCTQLSVRIEGWAAPGERNAQQVSQDRARAVEQFYIDNGIAASRAVTNGRGAATGATKDGASQYQRADSIPLRN
jgi:outer membrane protein OmpA-like peptidoglycan-associated protein